MRGKRRGPWGVLAIILGLIILFSVILPAKFWWLLVSVILIAAGLLYTCRC